MFLAELRDRLALRSSHNGSVIRLGVFVAEGGGGQDSTATAVIIGPRWLAVGSFKKRSVERREKEKKNYEEKRDKNEMKGVCMEYTE